VTRPADRLGLAGRSAVELMVLMLTGTICLALLFTGAAVAVIEIVHPESDTTAVISSMTDILSMILGALLGLLAGRSERSAGLHHKPADGTDDGL